MTIGALSKKLLNTDRGFKAASWTLGIFPFYFKSQSSNFYMLGTKKRPWKLVDLVRNAP